MQKRKKVGGIVDRRFGEDDPNMTPEEKALERFVKEKQRGGKKGTIFDLEDDIDVEQEGFTHLGQPLTFEDGKHVDDFNETEMNLSDAADTDEEGNLRSRKRRRLSAEDVDAVIDRDGEIEPERPKTKQEVMKEVIAKSKLHKYERQKTKEDDDDLREELDKGLGDIYALLRAAPKEPQPPIVPNQPKPEIQMNADRAALLGGKDRAQADKEYDERLRQMASDFRAKPTTRTKTEEEKLEEEAKRLKELEEKRLARMRGEDVDSADEHTKGNVVLNGDDDYEEDDEDFAGLGAGIGAQKPREELDVEDEDDFVIDDDLIASGSDLEPSDESDGSNDGDTPQTDDDEKEFVQGLLSKEEEGREGFTVLDTSSKLPTTNGINPGLAFTYPCPQNHDELIQITKGVSIYDLPTVIQRIRALYHPKLNSDNKAKLAVFSTILVDHISYLANQPEHPPFSVLETLIRHTHSLAKSYPDEIGSAFRTHLKSIHDERSTSLTAGDLLMLTAIASIFPTSDHFHSVVTPAQLTMARYLGQKVPQTLAEMVTGTYITSLCIEYQRLSKRYIPEIVNYTINTLSILSPKNPPKPFGNYPIHETPDNLRMKISKHTSKAPARMLRFWDINHVPSSPGVDESIKKALFTTALSHTVHICTLYSHLSAAHFILSPFHQVIAYLHTITLPSAITLPILPPLTAIPPPLKLHNHRPLAIKTAIPKFEDTYNPRKHYDPDPDRFESAKLKAEYKRERKGALRELRKDSNFVAREGLKEKKERDRAYEEKYKRLVAEVQGEEGREKNEYEREKRARKGARKSARGGRR
jgi:nucleolar protein 14